MKKPLIWSRPVVVFIMGMVSAVLLMILLGAAEPIQQVLPNGRYQLETWATRFDGKSSGMGAFVIDTATGETRTVYSRIYGTPPPCDTINNLKKPFSAIR